MHNKKKRAAVGSEGRFQNTSAPTTKSASFTKNQRTVGNISSTGSEPTSHHPLIIFGGELDSARSNTARTNVTSSPLTFTRLAPKLCNSSLGTPAVRSLN